MRVKIVIIVASLFFLTSLCSSSKSGSSYYPEHQKQSDSSVSLSMEESKPMKKVSYAKEADNIPSGKKLEIKLIKNAYITLEIGDYKEWKPKIEKIVKAAEGYISNSQLNVAENEYKRGTINIRVPKESFEKVITEIKSLGVLRSEQIEGKDVTESYYDIKSRLENKKMTRDRFNELKKQAKTTEELLNVEKEVQTVNAEIERLTGKINFYNNRINFSTINLSFFESEEKKAFWSSTFKPIGEAFGDGIRAMANVVAAIIIILIAIIPILILAYIVWKIVRYIYKKQKEKKIQT